MQELNKNESGKCKTIIKQSQITTINTPKLLKNVIKQKNRVNRIIYENMWYYR